MKNKFKSTIVLSLGLFAATAAQAGLISQHSSINTYQRTCPGLQGPNYIANWRPVLAQFYGLQPAEVSTNLACHFNGANQERYFNTDGTPKEGLDFLPNGPAFSADTLGSLTVTSAVGSTQVTIGSPDGKFYGDVTLDPDNLGLPQIKVKSESEPFERNSVNGFAASEFLWTGEAETLEYTVDFDFFNSGGVWSFNDAADIHDYIFELTFGVSTGMEFDENFTFPLDYGTELTSDYFSSVSLGLITATEDEPYTGSLTVSFDVNTGDKFFLWGQVQAFGLNGGFMDAAHTVTSRLNVEGLTEEESNQIFSTSLQPLVNIPEPATMMLLLSGLGFIGLRRKAK